MIDILIIALIIAYCIFLFVRHQKKKKDGTVSPCDGCCAGCSGCAGCGGVPYSEIYKDRQ